MTRNALWALVLLAAVFRGAPLVAAVTLRAGVAQTDITPPIGKYEVFASGKMALSVRDPLYAKAVVFESDRTRVAVVSLDLVEAFSPELFDAYRQRLQREAGIDYVVLSASHTHNSPYTRANHAELHKWPWTGTALEKVYQTVLEAHRDAVPVRIGVGYGQAAIGTNRRLVTPHGVQTLWRNFPGKGLNEPIDRRVGVLRLERETGGTLALIVHYACHPVTLCADDSTQFSADYVGEMAQAVSARAAGHPAVLFWQGAAGDINLRDTIRGSGEEEVRRYGRELAEAVLAGAAQAEPQGESVLSHSFETVSLASRWSEAVLAQLHKRGTSIDRWFEKNYAPSYSAPVGTLIMGRKLALIFLPGEPFIAFQLALDKNSPLAESWLLGYCDREIGYLPTIRAAAEGGYGGNGPETLVEVGAGEHLLNCAVIQLDRQLGLLRPMPGPAP